MRSNETQRGADAPESGYVPCACRDCFEIAITSGGPAFCWQCEEAGCEDYQGDSAPVGRRDTCQVEEVPNA